MEGWLRLLLDRWYILGPCAALLVFVSLVLFSNQDWRDHEAARVRIDDAQVVIRQASTLVHLLADAETGQREYILTADAEALKICEDSLNRIPAVLENLRRAKPMGTD